MERAPRIAERMIRGAKPLPQNVGAALAPASPAHEEPATADLGELLRLEVQPADDGRQVALWIEGTHNAAEVLCNYGEAIELGQAILQASKTASGGRAYPPAQLIPDWRDQPELPPQAGVLRSILVAPDDGRVVVYMRTADKYVLRVECSAGQAVAACVRIKAGARPLAAALVDMTIPKMAAELELERDKIKLAAAINPSGSSKAL